MRAEKIAQLIQRTAENTGETMNCVVPTRFPGTQTIGAGLAPVALPLTPADIGYWPTAVVSPAQTACALATSAARFGDRRGRPVTPPPVTPPGGTPPSGGGRPPRDLPIEWAGTAVIVGRGRPLSPDVVAPIVERLKQFGGMDVVIEQEFSYDDSAVSAALELMLCMANNSPANSLSLKFPGLAFNRRKLHTSPERTGTVVDISAASPEDVLRVFERYFDILNPGWSRLEQLHAVAGNVDVQISSAEFARKLLRWTYNCYDDSRSDLDSARGQIFTYDDKLRKTGNLDEYDRTQLRDTLAIINRNEDRYLKSSYLWHFVSQRARDTAKAGAFSEETASVLSAVVHDQPRRSGVFLIPKLAISRLLRNTPLPEKTRRYLAANLSNTLTGAIEEGVIFARPEIERARVAYSYAGAQHNQFANICITEGTDLYQSLIDIVANLVANAAIHHDPEKPPAERKVRLNAELLPGGFAEIAVIDTGAGMDEAQGMSLGASGHRLGRTPARGTGMGLFSIILQLRSRGWGPLLIKSAPGKGSTFLFVIPPELLSWTGDGEAPTSGGVTNLKGRRNPLTRKELIERYRTRGFVIPRASAAVAEAFVGTH